MLKFQCAEAHTVQKHYLEFYRFSEKHLKIYSIEFQRTESRTGTNVYLKFYIIIGVYRCILSSPARLGYGLYSTR